MSTSYPTEQPVFVNKRAKVVMLEDEQRNIRLVYRYSDRLPTEPASMYECVGEHYRRFSGQGGMLTELTDKVAPDPLSVAVGGPTKPEVPPVKPEVPPVKPEVPPKRPSAALADAVERVIHNAPMPISPEDRTLMLAYALSRREQQPADLPEHLTDAKSVLDEIASLSDDELKSTLDVSDEPVPNLSDRPESFASVRETTPEDDNPPGEGALVNMSKAALIQMLRTKYKFTEIRTYNRARLLELATEMRIQQAE